MNQRTDKVSWSATLAFGAPAIGAGYMYLILSLYVMKFSTDVLLIAPAVMGAIFSLSRIWDAISDPLAGYLSDRTTFRLGRRRTWILCSCIPISIGFYAVFAPPFSLQGSELTLWMTIAIIGFYSAMTLFFVPHMALGAELSTDYHERSRLFGVRHIFYTLGSILSLGAMYLLINEEFAEGGNVRLLARDLAFIAIGVMAVLVNCITFYLLGKVSPVSYQVIGQAKTVVIYGVGYYFFDREVSRSANVGALVALVGCIGYARMSLTSSPQSEDLRKKNIGEDED